jgi:hypothetical protein
MGFPPAFLPKKDEKAGGASEHSGRHPHL